MRSTRKFKGILMIFSLVLFITVPLYDNNFYTPHKLNKWRALTWDDFKGRSVPFSAWGAGIWSDVILEKDSMGQTRAYAVQDDQYSWTRKRTKKNDYALRHEQYHFNITEIFARKLNEFIRNNPAVSEDSLNKQLKEIRTEENTMQKAYDGESAHGLYEEIQYLWEYKIDSTLKAHSDDKGMVTDYYSGLSAYFPAQPIHDAAIDKENGIPYRAFQLKRYGMTFTMASLQNRGFDDQLFLENLYETFAQANLSLVETTENDSGFEVTVYDHEKKTVKRQFYTYRYPNLNYLQAEYESNLGDSTKWARIANTFLKSFEIKSVTSHWMTAASTLAPTGQFDAFDYSRASDNTRNQSECFVLEESMTHGFLSQQIYTQSDSMILAHHIIDQPDSVIYESVIHMGDEIFSAPVIDGQSIFKIALNDMPKGALQARIGYVLKEDTTETCFRYYNDYLYIINPEH